MPKFTIVCEIAKPYALTVEAPSLDAVLSYHEGDHLDEDEFSSWGESSWNLIEVEPLREDDTTTATLKLNDEGEPIEEE